jgi:molybdopterin converting factor small subunit
MHVEFLGIPRERAGTPDVEVEAATLGEMLVVLAARFPALGDLLAAGRLHSSIVANLNGDAFVTDPDTSLADDDHILLLSSNVGG